jgi:hypothetical protein
MASGGRSRLSCAVEEKLMDLPEAAEQRAVGWLRSWDLQGPHRTGTAGDISGAEWLIDEARRLGAEPAVEEWAFGRLDPVACFVEIDGARIDGVPVFDAPTTGPEGVVGDLGPVGSAALVGVAELSPHAVYTPTYEEQRRSACHAALIIVCSGSEPGLALLNAERFRTPYGSPAIQVSSSAGNAILAAAQNGARARVVANSRRTAARAVNVVIRLAGRTGRPPPLVVMTPRSSWWQSTAERGGGLVCWLETLRALLSASPLADVVFTANSGHELGHLGLDDFLERRPGWEQPLAAGGALWVHYGANIGAVRGALSIMSSDPSLAASAAQELARAGWPADRIAPVDLVPSGETRDIHRAGGRYLTLVGSNPWFHLPSDRWPHSVDAAAIARIAAGGAALVARLAG